MRVSSTPRPLDSITGASGILGHPSSRAMTVRRVGKSEACPPFRMRLPMDGGHGARAPLPTLIWGFVSQGSLRGRVGFFQDAVISSKVFGSVEQSRPHARPQIAP